MSEITAGRVKAILDQLAGPDYRDLFNEIVTARAIADDEAEEPRLRAVKADRAVELLGSLAECLAAEPAVREPVNA